MALTRNDLDHLHDTVYDALGLDESDEKLTERFNALPTTLKTEAEKWGCNDTDFGIHFYEHLITKND